MLPGTNYLRYVLRRALRRATGKLQRHRRQTVRVRPTFRTQASRIITASLQRTKRCRGGSHYRNLVTASGHAWVVFALEHDPQVREAATRAQAAAGVRDHYDSDGTDDNIPMLDAYFDGSVLAKGIEGSAAALVRVFGTDVSATVRFASVDVALSSGRSEWTGLVMALCILREVRASMVLRLGNL